jgi:hypothetical protein
MTNYHISCVTTEHPHRHITSVGIGGAPTAPGQRMTVTEVRDKLDAGDTFFTMGPQSMKVGIVRKDRCKVKGCDVKTITTDADDTADNNLDNLAVCP